MTKGRKLKKYKVWAEFERVILAYSQNEAEKIFVNNMNMDNIIINSQEIK